jgi:hypothetical protein
MIRRACLQFVHHRRVSPDERVRRSPVHTSAEQGVRPHVVRVRLPRRTAGFVGVVALSLALSSCGLLGGDDNAKEPVVIPSLTEPTPSGAGAPPGTTAPPGTAAPSVIPLIDPTQVPITVNNTVIRTGYIRQTRTAVRNVTAVATQRVTMPQVTVTQTVTESVTGSPRVSVSVTTETKTTTVTRFCQSPPAPCP